MHNETSVLISSCPIGKVATCGAYHFAAKHATKLGIRVQKFRVKRVNVFDGLPLGVESSV